MTGYQYKYLESEIKCSCSIILSTAVPAPISSIIKMTGLVVIKKENPRMDLYLNQSPRLCPLLLQYTIQNNPCQIRTLIELN